MIEMELRQLLRMPHPMHAAPDVVRAQLRKYDETVEDLLQLVIQLGATPDSVKVSLYDDAIVVRGRIP